MVKTSEMSMELKQELAFTKEELAELETKSQGLFHQIQKEVTFCGLPHGADA